VPPKATWISFETDPEFHFDFFLAEKLHRTLDEIRSMPAMEYLEWSIYFGRKAQQMELARMTHAR
jgi:hypothetical protein